MLPKKGGHQRRQIRSITNWVRENDAFRLARKDRVHGRRERQVARVMDKVLHSRL